MAEHCGASAATVQRIWDAHGLQPHRVRKFKLSRDPQFVEKLTDVVGLYLNPPDKALVRLCRQEEPDSGIGSNPTRLGDEEKKLRNDNVRLQTAWNHDVVRCIVCA
jgi:hypothetical protein